MAVLGTAQITLVDLTDAYGVVMTSESHTFPGSTSAALAGSVTTQIVAMRGAEQVPASVVLSEVSKPAGVTVTMDSDKTSPTLTVAVSGSVTSGGVVRIPVHIGDVTIVKEFSFAIAFKGATGAQGAAGASATTVVCGNDSQSIPCTSAGSTSAASTITIPFAGYVGTSRAACTVAASGLPSGISVSANTAATDSADGSLVLAVEAGSALGSAAALSGTITLTFSCNGKTFARSFGWSKAKAGAAGGTGAQGAPGMPATSVVCGNEAQAIPCTAGGLVAAACTITIPFAGYVGTSRAACTASYSALPSGVTLGSNTAATASADGSLVLNVAANATLGAAATLTGAIELTLSCNGQKLAKLFTWTKANKGQTGATGATGSPGADALTLVVTSSNGTIFKNSSVSTVLTAHVYKGGAELTAAQIAALGTVKWYKDGAASATATGTTLTIDAGDVANKADYVAKLEG
ncbi:hypothetical protein [Gordonibacter massiliensis (ex Traore et al. 2017)]|uniref:hypothetical protein n=1 Tax=Gordonibacter massiliensis (ex Traore et al. 2017) TaxID=1841863 RepID=UPI001C8BFED1|nr:hypothetical protein [Gordonibacter massiliensis (ex Traore et al. 2017)]MBX9032679.1 hypothetical protein [Gordonibacter massiliensis (ex Traore et al. 2017)]